MNRRRTKTDVAFEKIVEMCRAQERATYRMQRELTALRNEDPVQVERREQLLAVLFDTLNLTGPESASLQDNPARLRDVLKKKCGQ